MTGVPLTVIVNGKQARAHLGLGRSKFRRLVAGGHIPCWEDPDTGFKHYLLPALDEWARGNGRDTQTHGGAV